MVVERRTLWMGAAVLVAVVLAIVLWPGEDTPAASSAPARPARASATKGTPVDEGPVDVDLEALKHPRLMPVAAGRNPFRFQGRRTQDPDPDLDPDGPPPERAVSPPGPPGPVEPPRPVVPPGPPPPPPITVKVFGIAEQGGKKVAMLTDGRDPMAYKEGDIAYGQYRILKIGEESVEMAYLDGRGRQTIRLTGQ